jgi:hypothetical protein
LTAQAPAPRADASKPLRHLEYGFTISEQGMNEYDFNTLNAGAQAGAHAVGNPQSDGGSGTMLVDVLSVASDGALVVRISERAQNEPRARQAYTCRVYGNTSVLCPSAPAPSPAQWVLLSYLGRQFIDAAPWDVHGHWQRTQRSDEFTLQEDFTIFGDVNAKNVAVREVRKMQPHNGGLGDQTSDVTIEYDRTLEVPDSVHDDVVTTGDNGTQQIGSATYDFRILRDSFAKP